MPVYFLYIFHTQHSSTHDIKRLQICSSTHSGTTPACRFGPLSLVSNQHHSRPGAVTRSTVGRFVTADTFTAEVYSPTLHCAAGLPACAGKCCVPLGHERVTNLLSTAMLAAVLTECFSLTLAITDASCSSVSSTSSRTGALPSPGTVGLSSLGSVPASVSRALPTARIWGVLR